MSSYPCEDAVPKTPFRFARRGMSTITIGSKGIFSGSSLSSVSPDPTVSQDKCPLSDYALSDCIYFSDSSPSETSTPSPFSTRQKKTHSLAVFSRLIGDCNRRTMEKLSTERIAFIQEESRINSLQRTKSSNGTVQKTINRLYTDALSRRLRRENIEKLKPLASEDTPLPEDYTCTLLNRLTQPKTTAYRLRQEQKHAQDEEELTKLQELISRRHPKHPSAQ